jgi:hypothetical protein
MSYYNIKGGLHSAEIRLLQRALREHLQTATKHKADVRAAQKAGDPNIKAFELTQAQDAIDALVRLSNRLRKELEPVGPVEPVTFAPPPQPRLTCHDCRKQVPADHKGACPQCGAPREHIWL